ncbi:MAG: thioredoxin [Acidiferrobacterales bacterium]
MPTSPFIMDVTRQSFAALVLQKSRRALVMADFWAQWCAPCQMLAPLLAKLAQAYAGKCFLAKVNTDTEQELAREYGVRSLPTVKIFRDGAVVDQFIGLQPESAVRAIVERHLPRESDTLLAQAREARQSGHTDETADLLQQAMQVDPSNDRIKLELAAVRFEQSRLDDTDALVGELAAETKTRPDALALIAQLKFARIAVNAPPLEALERKILADPNDNEARTQLGARQVLAKDYESALQNLLDVVKHDRSYDDDAGRKGMLAIFAILEGKGELVNRYRSLLAATLN